MTDDALRRIDALLQVALRVARSASTGRVALAQLARSIEPRWLPRPWADSILLELETAREQACEPIPVKQVEQALRAAWRVRPSQELDELDPEPAAVTPTAQVHRAVLEGRPVAVKVLRPGLAAAVRQDLSLLEALAAPLGAAFPTLDVAAATREVRERVLEELDLESTATTQRRFHRALRDHPLFLVPAPTTRLAHHSVLVSEWIDGVSFRAAADPDEAAARLVRFVVGAARWGIAPADLDPDDVLVQEDGRVAILDLGSTRAVDSGRLEQTARAVNAVAAGDHGALSNAVAALGWLPEGHVQVAEELGRHVLGELTGAAPSRLDSDAVLAARDRLLGRPEQLLELILAGSLAPEDLWPARGVAALFGTIARVGASGRWLELVRVALGEGWQAAPPA